MSKETKKAKLLRLLKQGVRISELKGLNLGLGTSMRSRVSELRKEGHDIKDKFVKNSNTGSRYKEYYMEIKK